MDGADIMNLELIKKYLNQIERCKSDNETAHALEDEMHKDFVTFVAKNGTPELKKMAKEILKSNKINFKRLCS